MPKTYELCDAQVCDLIENVGRRHHADLVEAGVTVQAVFARDVDDDGNWKPAMKRNGYLIAAKIQITSLHDRVRGVPDAKLTIDQYSWDHLPEASRAALIDHELEHLILSCDDEGSVNFDDHGRPKLKTRPHDWELTGFTSVVERNGEAAVEAREMRRFIAEQLPLWPTGTMAKVA